MKNRSCRKAGMKIFSSKIFYTKPTRWTFAALAALVIAGCAWSACLHSFFKRDLSNYRSPHAIPPGGMALAETYLAVWSDAKLRQAELDKMRQNNPEWDFMSRTYFVLALANMGLRDKSRLPEVCVIIDSIIRNTLEIESEKGFQHFLLSYGHSGGWTVNPPGSIFVDGEIALMLAARRLLQEKDSYKPLLTQRVQTMISRMRRSPVLCAESYPDECWLFCNTVALASIRMADVLDGSDHADFLAAWVANAKKKLVEPKTGILISAFAVDGTPAPCGFGPEGSTIWMASHMLQLVDKDFANDQYRRARHELGRSFLGFGYSREWPAGSEGSMDVDSGPVIPVFGASLSASGLAILAAAVFDDNEYLQTLLTSLEFAGFPVRNNGKLRYQASNQVGDAVLLYAMMEGPLWDLVHSKMKK